MPLLALDRVSKRYRRGVREVAALDEVSLELFESDLVGVLGGARSGKTTLLRVAAGIEAPDAGRVLFLGRDVAAMSRRERQAMLRSQLGCVWRPPTAPRRLPVADQVALPLIGAGWSRGKALERAREQLRRGKAEHCIDALLSELSPGELARVSIAQALIREPRLVLADEPTDTLGLIERDEVLALLSAAAEAGVGVLLTTSEASGLIRTTRMASLDAGRLLRPAPQGGQLVELDRARSRSQGPR